ncbi:MAG: gfo/Idh/MocA family oxidoreductase, partial [Anaerolineae bacterium]|nr:gfo/Idh/MocA family oxidoreductase [Anaerolineae bacterium]
DAGLLFEPRPYDYREFDVEDFASGYMRLENGGSLVLRTSWAANVEQGAGSAFILGTEGGLMFHPLRYITNQGHYMVETVPQVPRGLGKAFSGHFMHHAHAIKVLRGEEEKIVKREEVLNVIRALDALYESAEVGHEVTIG